MNYGTIKGVEKQISKIFLGTGDSPYLEGENCDELLDMMTGLGINAIDTARKYGMAEKSIGHWLRHRGKRDDIVLLSKCGHPEDDGTKRVNYEAMREDFNESSEYLGTGYIDIYLLHRDDTDVPVSDIIKIFNEMHKEGKIGAFGGSNWTAQRVREANEYAISHELIPFTVSSPNFGLAEQVNDPWGGGCVSIAGPAGRDDRAYYMQSGTSVIAYSSLGRGFFSGKIKSDEWEKAPDILDIHATSGYMCDNNRERLKRCEELAEKKGASVSEIAMAWIFAQKMNTFAVVSSRRKDRMMSNIRSMDLMLSDEEVKYLAYEI